MSTQIHYQRVRTPFRLPTQRELIDADMLERCAHCNLRFPSNWMTEEDGRRVCPNRASPSSIPSVLAANKERAAEEMTQFIPRPHVSQGKLAYPTEPTVMSLEDSGGALIYSGNPLRIVRGDADTLVVRGQYLSSGDVYEFPADVSAIATVIDTENVSLAITVGVAAVVGSHNIEFNETNTLRGVLRVR